MNPDSPLFPAKTSFALMPSSWPWIISHFTLKQACQTCGPPATSLTRLLWKHLLANGEVSQAIQTPGYARALSSETLQVVLNDLSTWKPLDFLVPLKYMLAFIFYFSPSTVSGWSVLSKRRKIWSLSTPLSQEQTLNFREREFWVVLRPSPRITL